MCGYSEVGHAQVSTERADPHRLITAFPANHSPHKEPLRGAARQCWGAFWGANPEHGSGTVRGLIDGTADDVQARIGP
jgi:hypothetical protein